MDPARIAELLDPFLAPADGQPLTANDQRLFLARPELSEGTNDLDRISIYIDLLLRWNARINLTAIRDPEQIVTRHFGESLFAARHLFPSPSRGGADASSAQAEQSSAVPRGRAALEGRVKGQEEERALAPVGLANDRRPTTNDAFLANDQQPTASDRISLADIGSGAGFPGIPIKLWAPQISVTLIESNHKKAAFLREVVRALTLTDINILTTRAEHLLSDELLTKGSPNRARPQPEQSKSPLVQQNVATYDVVTLRAVEKFANILPTAAALTAPHGRLALLIGSSQQPRALSSIPTFHWLPPIPVPLSKERSILIGTNEPKE